MSLSQLFSLADKSPQTRALSVTLVTIFFIGIITGLGFLNSLELKTLDVRQVSAERSTLPDSAIVLLAIDQNSLDFFEEQGVPWPWPREFYGVLVSFLSEAGVKAIAFDLDFSSKGLDRQESSGEESDFQFAEAMQDANRVILTAHLSVKDIGDQSGASILPRHTFNHKSLPLNQETYNRASAPIEMFQSTASRLGVVNFEADEDGVARKIPLLYSFNNAYLPQFAFAIYEQVSKYAGIDPESKLSELPLNDRGEALIKWYGRSGSEGVFPYLSAASVLVSSFKFMGGVEPDIKPDYFKDKLVIVGATAAGLWDYKPTPFSSLEPCPGMEIHATILSNLLNDDFIKYYPKWLEFLLIVLIAFLVSQAFFQIRRLEIASVLILVLLVGFVAASYWVFITFNYWVPVVAPLSALGLSLLLSAMFSYATEGKQKRELRRIFSRYLSPQVIEEVVERADEIELGGKEVQATVFFSDIKGFTSISENLPPKQLVSYLNEYLSLGSDILQRHGAMIDKYIGDAIMALFGAPVTANDHAKNACLAALEMQDYLTRFYQAQQSDDLPEFITRIGLHSGTMVIGHIGSSSRSDYTAIGDTVNTASRLEGVNKQFGTNIIISESTYEQAKNFVEVRELDSIRVKGRHKPISIFELMAKKGEITPQNERKRTRFADGLNLYRAKAFHDAQSVFKSILEENPGDGPSQTYVSRCETLAQQTLPERWDGVFTLTTK